MTDTTTTRSDTVYTRIAVLAGWAVIAIALVALLGWITGVDRLTRVVPSLPVMKANTAIGLLAAGVALRLLARGRAIRAGRLLGVGVALLGAVVALEHLAGGLGIDELLFADPGSAQPGRPTALTAVAFIAIGLALASIPARSPWPRRVSTVAAFVVVLFGVVGYLFAVSELRGADGRSGIALGTLAAFALLAAGLVCLTPTRGLAGLLRGHDAGARAARVLLPVMSAWALAIGALTSWGRREGILDAETSAAAFTLAMVLGLGAVILVTARRLRLADVHLQRLATVVESSADAMVSIDLAGRLTSWNPGAVRLFGYEASEVLGRHVSLIVPPERRDEFAERMERVHAGASIADWSTQRRRKDGVLIDVELTVAPIRDITGAVIGGAAVVRDVSERQLAGRRFETLLEAAPDAIVIVDGVGRITLVNRQAEVLSGYTREELVGGPVERIVPRRARHDHAEYRERFAQEGHARPMGTEVLTALETKDGREIPVEVSLSPLETPTERLVIAAVRDVSERLAAERALAESEERFRRSFDDSGIGMALVSARPGGDSELLEVNAALVQITGYPKEELRRRGPAGVVHPADVPLVLEPLRALLRGEVDVLRIEPRIVAADGQVRWTALAASLVRDHRGAPAHAVLQVQDVTERRRFEEELQVLADHDPLTGLLNRRRIEEELEREVAAAHRYGPGGAVLVLDLDDFKLVNDSFGHAAGDQLIRRVSEALRARLRETDALGRLGGDEFAAVVPHIDVEDARALAQDLLVAVRTASQDRAGALTGRVSASVGIATFDRGSAATAEELLARADIAMYDAKEAGRNCVAVFDAAAPRHHGMRARLAWVDRIETALEEDRFLLHAQPIARLGDAPDHRWELLLRMEDSDGEPVLPGRFLPVAERSDLAQRIDRWVLTHALELLRAQQTAGVPAQYHVNLSARSVGDPDMCDFVVHAVGASGIDPSSLVLEVTESTAITDLAAATHFARAVRDAGCRLAIDDFGMGFASFLYLKHLPFDVLKIDGEFIADLARHPTNQLIVQSMVTMARGLGKRTVAEGVDDEATLPLLRAYGVDYAQGFHVGRPAPVTIPTGGPTLV